MPHPGLAEVALGVARGWITERRSYYGNDACPTELQYYFYGERRICGAWLTGVTPLGIAFQRAVLAG